MAQDAESVQQESVAKTASGEGTSEAPAAPTLQDIERIVSAAVETSNKRLKQSFDDKLKAELGKVRGGQSPHNDVLSLLENADPEVKAQYLEKIFRGQQEQAQKAQLAEQQRAAYEKVVNEWSEDNTQFLKDLDIAPDDKRLDWGDPEKEALSVRQRKLHASAAKILKSDRDASTRDAKKKVDEDVARAAVEAGLESNAAVGSSPSAGLLTREDMKKHEGDRDWVLANWDRIEAARKAGKF